MEKLLSILVMLLTLLASLIGVFSETTEGTSKFSFSGSSNDSCANVDCQQGTCVPNTDFLTSILFPYKCQCNSGWSTLESVVSFLSIPSLPCNVPNCSLNLNCSGNSLTPAPAPASSAQLTSNNSSACLMPGICGHGKCEMVKNNTLIPTFKCVCDSGYANVLNLTGGYCVNQCEIGGSCQNLNITLPGLSSPPPPSTSGSPADQTASPPNAGTPPPPGTPGSPADQSASPPNAGCRSTPFNNGFYIAAALILGSFLASLY